MATFNKRRRKTAEAISRRTGGEASHIHVCMADDMHPYNCDGMFGGECIHCERRKEDEHVPDTCALCNWDAELPDNEE